MQTQLCLLFLWLFNDYICITLFLQISFLFRFNYYEKIPSIRLMFENRTKLTWNKLRLKQIIIHTNIQKSDLSKLENKCLVNLQKKINIITYIIHTSARTCIQYILTNKYQRYSFTMNIHGVNHSIKDHNIVLKVICLCSIKIHCLFDTMTKTKFYFVNSLDGTINPTVYTSTNRNKSLRIFFETWLQRFLELLNTFLNRILLEL